MHTTPARQATDLLLSAMFHMPAPTRRPHQFMYGKPGSMPFSGQAGYEINYDEKAMLKASLFIRRGAAPYLRTLAVHVVDRLLHQFVVANFWLISSEAWDERGDSSFADFLSEPAKMAFCDALARSNIFLEPRELTLFPLSVIRVSADFVSRDYFLTTPLGLKVELLPKGVRRESLRPEAYPPFERSSGGWQVPSAWLGIWAPNIEAAKRMRAAVLGAIALLPHPMERYLFTGRKILEGHCTIQDRQYEISTGEAHTPALSEDIAIDLHDHAWLAHIADLWASSAVDDKKKIRALDYYYRAWVPDPVRRFPILFGALDAVFGDAGRATQAVVEAVSPVMGPDYDPARIKLMLGLRASVIHGGAPNVYESNDYHRYYVRYETDAVRDLELIVARCFQEVIFEGKLIERDHTYRALIKQKLGRDV